MKIMNFLLLYIILMITSFSYSQINESDFCIGAKTKIYSKVLKEERELLIYLPEHYNSTNNNYPVLYVLDGEWNFLHSISYIVYLSDNKIVPDMIIVAIANTNRLRDFLPTHVAQVPESGGSNNFIKFIKDELIPFINKNYRTTSDRILYGESNSGLFGIYSLFKNPDLFDDYIISSPTMAHDNYYVNKLAKEVIQDSNFPQKNLILIYGSEEGQWMISQVLEFIKILKNNSPSNLKYEIIELTKERHASPIALYKALRKLYQNK